MFHEHHTQGAEAQAAQQGRSALQRVLSSRIYRQQASNRQTLPPPSLLWQ